MYTRKSKPLRARFETKNLTSPLVDANHSKKPISEEDSSPIYNLAQLHKLHTKEFLSFCTAKEPPQKLIYSFPS